MNEGQSVQIKNRPLECKHCGRGQFVPRRAKLNTTVLEFFDMGWLNQSADIYVCTHCGFLHWFLEPQGEQQASGEVQATEDDQEQVASEEPETEEDLAEPTECVACHQRIPAGTARCPACGWSYK